MAITTRPVSNEFALAYAYDPAFDTGRADYEAEYERCLDTLDFSPITREGQRPTLFVFKPLPISAARHLSALGAHLWAWLAFRCCLVRIENGHPGWKIERTLDGRYTELGKMLDIKLTEELELVSGLLGRDNGELITVLGMAAYLRSTVPSPKS